jgi:putative nucleotidyltransferase with HDIG domain
MILDKQMGYPITITYLPYSNCKNDMRILNDVICVINESFPKYPISERDIDEKTPDIYYLTYCDAIVAAALVAYSNNLDDELVANLYYVSTKPQFRKLGLMSKLFHHITKKCIVQMFNKIISGVYLLVLVDNTGAINIYKRNKFIIMDTFTAQDGRVCHVMVLTLKILKESNINISIDTVFTLLKKNGKNDYIGENVTQIHHMISTAMLAEKLKYPKELIVAALLHDVGHLIDGAKQMGNLGVLNHEVVGANYLKEFGFNDLVCDLVRNHVNAKRYLVSIDVKYKQNLSKASLETLNYQGGFMSLDELEVFKNDKNFDMYIKLRKLDEDAKNNKDKLVDLEHFRKVCFDCCE